MGEKQLVTAGAITRELILGYILFGILFGFAYGFVYSILSAIFPGMIMKLILAIVLQGLTAFGIWRCSINTAFKKKTIKRYDVSTVIKNMSIFTIIICLVSAILNFAEIGGSFEETVNKELDSNVGLRLTERYMEMLDSEAYQEYQKELEKEISKAKTQLYGYTFALEAGLLVTYLVVVHMQRRTLLELSE